MAESAFAERLHYALRDRWVRVLLARQRRLLRRSSRILAVHAEVAAMTESHVAKLRALNDAADAREADRNRTAAS